MPVTAPHAVDAVLTDPLNVLPGPQKNDCLTHLGLGLDSWRILGDSLFIRR